MPSLHHSLIGHVVCPQGSESQETLLFRHSDRFISIGKIARHIRVSTSLRFVSPRAWMMPQMHSYLRVGAT